MMKKGLIILVLFFNSCKENTPSSVTRETFNGRNVVFKNVEYYSEWGGIQGEGISIEKVRIEGLDGEIPELLNELASVRGIRCVSWSYADSLEIDSDLMSILFESFEDGKNKVIQQEMRVLLSKPGVIHKICYDFGVHVEYMMYDSGSGFFYYLSFTG